MQFSLLSVQEAKKGETMQVELKRQEDDRRAFDVLIIRNDGKVIFDDTMHFSWCQNSKEMTVTLSKAPYRALMKWVHNCWKINGRIVSEQSGVLFNCKVWLLMVLQVPIRIVKQATLWNGRRARWDCMLSGREWHMWAVQLSYPTGQERLFSVNLSRETLK